MWRTLRMTINIVLNILFMLAIGGCCKHVDIVKPEMRDTSSRNEEPLVYESNVSMRGEVSGALSVAARNASDVRSFTSETFNESAGQSVAVTGDELNSCEGRSSRRMSEARISASGVIRVDSACRALSTTLVSSSVAQGGHGRKGLVCSGHYDSEAHTRASLSGRVELSFTNKIIAEDNVIITLQNESNNEGSVEMGAVLKIVNDTGKEVSQQLQAGVNIVPISNNGKLFVECSMTSSGSSAGAGATRPSHAIHVSVQSMRDALNLCYSQPLTPSSRLVLPVSVKRRDLIEQFNQQILGTDGKLTIDELNGGKEIEHLDYVHFEFFNFEFYGDEVLVKCHVAAKAKIWLFRPGTSADVYMRAKPVINAENQITFEQVRFDIHSENFLIKVFNEDLVQLVQDKVRNLKIDVSKKTSQIVESINAKFPLKIGPVCVAANVNDLRVRDVRFVRGNSADEDEIRANVYIQVQATNEQCK